MNLGAERRKHERNPNRLPNPGNTAPSHEPIFDRFREEPVDEGKAYDDEQEARKRLYLDSEGRMCQPATYLREACLVKSGSAFPMSGRKSFKEAVQSGVFISPLMIPHVSAGWVIDRQHAVVNRGRILRCRPRLDEWELLFQMTICDERLEPVTVKNILHSAGKFVGIGDFRPRYGLFELVKFEVIENVQEKAA